MPDKITIADQRTDDAYVLPLADGTIQVAGREFDKGTSHIAIVGGTGRYRGISGEMQSVNNGDGTFTQTLRYLEK